jgi:hypothetical protein
VIHIGVEEACPALPATSGRDLLFWRMQPRVGGARPSSRGEPAPRGRARP